MPGLFTACVKSAEPPIVVTGVIEQHLVLTQALKGPDPERAAIINRMPKPFCIARKRPGQISGWIKRAQPPIIVTWVIKENLVLINILKPTKPEWTTVVNGMSETLGVAGQFPGKVTARIKCSEPPVVITGVIKQNLRLSKTLKFTGPERPAIPNIIAKSFLIPRKFPMQISSSVN